MQTRLLSEILNFLLAGLWEPFFFFFSLKRKILLLGPLGPGSLSATAVHGRFWFSGHDESKYDAAKAGCERNDVFMKTGDLQLQPKAPPDQQGNTGCSRLKSNLPVCYRAGNVGKPVEPSLHLDKLQQKRHTHAHGGTLVAGSKSTSPQELAGEMQQACGLRRSHLRREKHSVVVKTAPPETLSRLERMDTRPRRAVSKKRTTNQNIFQKFFFEFVCASKSNSAISFQQGIFS